MTHYHDHHCYHDLRYCSVCDKCYCTKCSREWGRYSYYGTWSGTGIGGNFYSSSGTGTALNKMDAINSTIDDKQMAEIHTHQEQKK